MKLRKVCKKLMKYSKEHAVHIAVIETTITKNWGNNRSEMEIQFHIDDLSCIKKQFTYYLNKIKTNSCGAAVSDYHYCKISFNKAWTQVLRSFKSCLRRVGDSRWWGSLTIVPDGNKARRLSSVNHNTKAIYHHHHNHH